uniref:Protein kinase domain-containing protein n=1 Tax=Syphacia muris TaxID=451379 RepID=A0A158R3V2_9BILA
MSAFELKRVSTEVVHRSSSALSVSNSQWDVLPTANGNVWKCCSFLTPTATYKDCHYSSFTEEENSTNKNVLVGVTSSHINQPGTSNMHVSSRSMSNLRCGGTANLSVASPKRIRKKWDMMNEGTSEFSDSGFFSRKVPDTGMNSIPFINNNNSPGLPPTPQSQFIQHNSNFSNADFFAIVYSFEQCVLADSDPQKYMHKKMTVVATDDQAHNSYLAASKQIDDAFQDLVQPKVSTPESNFDRCSSSRCSLTKRYMNTSFPNDEPRSVCTPGTISTRRATMNTQYSSESPSNSFRRQSDVHEQGTPRLYQQNGAVEGTFSEDGKSVRRARTIHRLKQRRSTLGAADSSILDSHKDDDYMMSDLYLRSRSQSPSHLALNALNEGRDDQRLALLEDSEAALSPSLASSRLVPSSSRKNLRSAEVTSKLNEIRDQYACSVIFRLNILRKSHENLAGALSGEMTPLSSVMFRSRSIGNLRFSTPFSVNNQQSEMFDSRTGLDSLTRARELSDNARKDVESQNLLSSHSRLMARSVGSLHSHDSIDSGSGESGNMHLNQRKVGSRLARTMENLKKASNPDLTHQSLYECSVSSENYCVPVFPSVSRFTQQGKGAVQKRVERYQPRNRISRDTTSGESDSNASDVNTATTLHGVGVNGGFAVPKRYFSPLSVHLEIPARFGLIQNTKRMFEQQRHNSSGTLRRVPNYLAQKLSLGGTSNSDVGPEEFPRLSNASSEVTSLRDFTGKTFEATTIFDQQNFMKSVNISLKDLILDGFVEALFLRYAGLELFDQILIKVEGRLGSSRAFSIWSLFCLDFFDYCWSINDV